MRRTEAGGGSVLSLALAVGLAWIVLPDSAEAQARFGTGCQKSYENGWQTTLDHVWKRCGWFNDELDDTDHKIFYFDLHGAEWWWEGPGDQLSLDNVHLFYSSTHGGAWSTKSVWAMWDDGSLASSADMRLGDESYGLSIFSTYACKTLKFSDDKMWARMGPIFRGGLRYATGSHDLLYDSVTTDETGEDFADDLQKGKSIRFAWKDANSDWWVDNDVTVMTTGTDSSNCLSRRSGMKWQNFGGYARLRDGKIGWYCYTYWNNL